MRWKDLIPLTRLEQLVEITLPLPWLALSLFLYSTPAWLLGLAASFYVFLTGLRLSHEAQHSSLGVPRWGHDAILFALSMLMGTSMHAVQAAHLNHHRHAFGSRDIEGRVAALPFPAILWAGPRFIVDLHRFALTQGPPRRRRWVVIELAAIAAVWSALRFAAGACVHRHQLAMIAGEAMAAFFAVWIVHRDSGRAPTRSRTERRRWVNWVTYDMLLHAEHHAYPAVPTPHWSELARRRDATGDRIEHDVVTTSGWKWG